MGILHRDSPSGFSIGTAAVAGRLHLRALRQLDPVVPERRQVREQREAGVRRVLQRPKPDVSAQRTGFATPLGRTPSKMS